MCNRFAISILAFAWVHGLIAFAEEQAAQLPDDGWWVSYSATTTVEFDGKVNESPIKGNVGEELKGVIQDDIIVEDHGTDAKSKLPANN